MRVRFLKDGAGHREEDGDAVKSYCRGPSEWWGLRLGQVGFGRDV